jgi:hypothetical protein
MTRSLTLRRETLAALTVPELAGVHGGHPQYTDWAQTCPVVQCLGWTSYVGACPTLPECP